MSAGQLSHYSGRGGQHNKRMRIAGLLVRTVVSCVDTGQPAPVRRIAQPAGEPSESLSSKISIAGPAQQVSKRVHMKHPRCDVAVDRTSEIRLTLRIEPCGTAERMWKVPAEIEQSITFGCEHRSRDSQVW